MKPPTVTSIKKYVDMSKESFYGMFPAIINVLHLEKQKNAKKHKKHKNSKNTNLTKLVNSCKNIFKYFQAFL
jgi:hypothetical protein